MGGKDTADSLNAWADKLVADKKWGVIMAHGIATGYAALSDPEIFRAHLKYVKSRESDIWVDTFANVARYEKERDDAKVTVAQASSGKLTWILGSMLDPIVFNVPLTLIVDVGGAIEVHAERKGKSLPVKVGPKSFEIETVPAPEPIEVTWK